MQQVSLSKSFRKEITVFFYLARLLLLCTSLYKVYHKFHDFIFFLCFGFYPRKYLHFCLSLSTT